MNEWGVTQFGFRRMTYADIIADMERKAQDLFGADIDLSSVSPLALFLRVVAYALALAWYVAEKVYYAAYVDTSTGQSLDYAVKFAGISRLAPTPAKRMLRFTGDEGTVITQGFLVETPAGPPRFATVAEAVIPASGEVEILAIAVEPGTAGNLAPGTLTRIVNPIAGIEAVTNIDSEDNIDGTDRENDRELRERYELSLAKGGASTRPSIAASILEVPGVRSVKVFHNTAMVVDADGRPPKSVEAVVVGGTDESVAQAILDTLAAGIEPYGTVTVLVEDNGGELQTVRFSRAVAVDVYVSVTVTVNSQYPSDGDTQIADNIIAYIGGADSTGEYHRGTGLGEGVIYSRIIAACYEVEGLVDVSVTLGTAPNPTGMANISVGDRELVETSLDKVVVTHA